MRGLVLAVLLVGCPSVAEVEGPEEPTPEEATPEDVVPAADCTLDRTLGFGMVGPDWFRVDGVLRGVFEPWDGQSRGLIMQLEDGGQDGIGVYRIEEFLAAVPESQDGSTLDLDSQMLSHESGNDGFVALYTPEGELLYQEGYDPGGGDWPMWSVRVADDGWCETRPADEDLPACNEFATRKPVEFTRGNETTRLYQGQQATVGGYRLQLHLGVTWSGDTPEDKCPGSEYHYSILRVE